MSEIFNDNFDIIVVGGGHAGCEASLACSRLGAKTLLIVLDKDTVGYMPCNPSIGGTGKGHLVREIDALGGEMGINTDKTMLQIKMLNRGKGAAVQSLRAQSDMYLYHEEMLKTIVNQPNLTLLEDEATDILAENGKVIGVKTKGGKAFSCTSVVLCCGVYLNSITITGDEKRVGGPASFGNASSLTDSLIKLGFDVKRFKTGRSGAAPPQK